VRRGLVPHGSALADGNFPVDRQFRVRVRSRRLRATLGMTEWWRGVRARFPGGSWLRHPVALPVGVALLTVVLLAGLAAVAAHEAGRTFLDDAQQRVESNRDAAVRALRHQSDELKREMAVWAVNPSFVDSLIAPTPAALGATQAQLSLLARSAGAPTAFVNDVQGRTTAIYPAQPDLLGVDFSFRDWYRGVSATGEPYVSTAYRTAATGHPLVVAVAAPVRNGSRVVGSVVVLWQLDSVRGVSEGARVDDGVTLIVTDQRGQPLAGTLTVDTSGQAVPVQISDATRQALDGHSASTVVDGMLESTAPVPGLGWTVTAALPLSVALAPSRTFERSLYVTLGVTLLLVLVVTILAARFAGRRAAELTATRAAEDGLRASEDRFRRLFDEALTGELLVNTHGDVIRVNSTLVRVLGREPEDLIGQPLAAIFDDDADRSRILELIETGDGEMRAEMTLSDADGRSLRGLVALSWMRELDNERVLLAQIEDITARRDAEQRLIELSLHDELTGLPNRRLLLERCDHAFAVARSGRTDSTSVAALFIDLDGFKPVNDRAGHDAGDRLLAAIADDLLVTLRPTDTVARVGGDEFVVLIGQRQGVDGLQIIAARVTAAIRRQVFAGETALEVSASVGIARIDLVDEPDAHPDELLRRADVAMYRAKDRGGNGHEVFEAGPGDGVEDRGVPGRALRADL
jgi:diguanylate cyclase (GGDEF)-like protein/PAS domain S-box-containing protein